VVGDKEALWLPEPLGFGDDAESRITGSEIASVIACHATQNQILSAFGGAGIYPMRDIQVYESTSDCSDWLLREVHFKEPGLFIILSQVAHQA